MALISDAVHNLSDTGSIGVSLIARTFVNKKANKQMRFGYRRADIIGAFGKSMKTKKCLSAMHKLMRRRAEILRT